MPDCHYLEFPLLWLRLLEGLDWPEVCEYRHVKRSEYIIKLIDGYRYLKGHILHVKSIRGRQWVRLFLIWLVGEIES